jgi:hypothetical protein
MNVKSILAALILCVATTQALALAMAFSPLIPDAKLTPGVIGSTDQATVCGSNADGETYSQSHRITPKSLKDKVYTNYGVTPDGKSYEIDHRLPLALGGADVEANLWPQAWIGQCGAHAKDRIEDRLWRAVCKDRSMSLADAQAILLGPYWKQLPGCTLPD